MKVYNHPNFMKILKTIIVLLLFLSFQAAFVHAAGEERQRAVKRTPVKLEKGRWAFSFQGLGDIPTNQRARKHFRSGLGAGLRTGYGFWEGLSVELEFQYDLLLKEKGTNKIEENKNLYTLAPGLRYTDYFIKDAMSWYLFVLPGVTFDYTKSINSTFNFSYAGGMGFDFDLTENLYVGPVFKYRHVVEDVVNDFDMDVHLISIGASVTYLFDK